MGNLIVLALLGAVFYYIFKSYSKYEGYSKEREGEPTPVRINGSMISEEDGFRMMKES